MLLPYEWIKSNLKLKQRAKDVASALTMVGLEVALLSDTEGRSGILEASLTPNRSDCLSVLGLSREIAAIYDKPLELKPRSLPTGDGIIRLKMTSSALDIALELLRVLG
jgi:phenylalanyl-tRNA synthetase beta subunit